MGATNHFVARAVERMGCTPDDARLVGAGIIASIKADDGAVQFISRVDKRGCRLFRFKAPDGRSFYALVDTDTMSCVTVLPPGYVAPRQGREPIKLREIDL
jgi:hypothetical protein